ncbi:FK506-binding protein 5 isoform X4 [Halyomorpha halys]|uniref:FK506-binding protein 5 isoform X4 n=1 Tax=Halyomorpha halys TaxID=286706 RepID=UPI0034D29AC3
MAKSLNYHDVTIKEEMTDGPTIKEEMTDEPTIKEEMTDEPTIKEEITDESESSCSLISCGVTIKEEIKEETESNSLTLDIKEEDNQQIYYDGLVHVKQDEDVIVPDEAATIIIKEEEGSPIYLETIPLPGQIIIKQENEDDYDGGGNVSNKESDFEEEQGVKKCEIWIVENSSTVDNNKNCSTRKGGLIQVKREKEILVLDEGEEDDNGEEEDEAMVHPTQYLEIEETESDAKQCRKRNRAESKKEERKRLRNVGKSYVTEKGKFVEEKKFSNPNCNCRKKCFEKISEDTRKNTFDSFWKTGSFTVQNEFLCSLIKLEEPKRHRPKGGARAAKSTTKYYYVTQSDGTSVNVCKEYFLKTFQISDGRMTRATRKMKAGQSPGSDNRGKRKPVMKYLTDSNHSYHLNDSNFGSIELYAKGQQIFCPDWF